MKGVWILVAVTGALVAGGTVFLFAIRSGELDKEIVQSPEYKETVRKLGEIREQVGRTVRAAAASVERFARDLQGDPRFQPARADLDRIARELSIRLEELEAAMASATKRLEKQWDRFSDQGRAKAVAALDWARTQAGKIEAGIAHAVSEIREAAGDRDALEQSRQELERQLLELERTRERVLQDNEF